MDLTNNIVSEFVKITNDNRKEKQTSTYGKVVIYNDEKYVQLDGSDLLTPADTTVHVNEDERVMVSVNGHNATITGNLSDISASNGDLMQFKVDTNGMFLTLRDEFDTKMTDFRVTTDGMFLTVSNNLNELSGRVTDFQATVDGMFVNVQNSINIHSDSISTLQTNYASLSVKADQIQSTVNSKIGADEVGTIVTQNATSWGLSINGKLSGTNYNFDGNNFSIGSTSGNTAAYHAAGYSKWTHSDGSYTQISAKGMAWSKGGTTSGYHYLMYAGEYTCNSEQTVTVTLPDEFKGKPFKVVTSVKRIYISSESYVTGCYFPLLSFYAEALNTNRNTGTFQVYASIRAWNRTSYGGWGQLIGNGTTAAEREALKPVVAYWAFV